ncbi:glutathione S-transferase family protein [Paraferrimonas sp. SM1919]|uniref:glutathione S-transferase family protein n=1 Tax=Paraferrimonas sp. SM1919 TaxID=2662263 RepID=UPI0013D0AB9C|nr:glutathione S-transferase family protein [Paraferrimonas sp. SM1919]
MYKLYIGNKNYSSWSFRPWLLMKTLGIEFEEVLVPFAGSNTAAQFKAFSPSSLVPCLHDYKVVVNDSLAIIEYLAEEYQQVWPQEKRTRAWARSACAQMHSGFFEIRNQCPMNCGITFKLNDISAALAADIEKVQALLEYGLQQFGGPFLAGNHFTAVDAFYAPVLSRFKTYQIELSPILKAYSDKIESLVSWQTWYQQAIAETFRDDPHEAELATLGTIIEDRRAIVEQSAG